MKQGITNNSGFSLSMAVWLAHDDYDGPSEAAPQGEVISVTTLLVPTRIFVLQQRLPEGTGLPDVTDRIAARFGQAIHADIEKTWRQHYATAMRKLGMSQKMIDKIRINPEKVEPGEIPVYLEQRYYRVFDGVVISGKFDEIINGQLNDTKTSSTYSYMNGTNEESHTKQLSAYRWISPEKVTSEIGNINHIFTDWQRMMTKQNPNYPKHRVTEVSYQLQSLKETESWIKAKLDEIRANVDLPEEQVIRCTPDELWMSPPQYKYYADPAKADLGGRSTKNCDSMQEAMTHMATKGKGKGKIIVVPSEPKRCGYCPVYEICTQKDEYFHD
jgi:hypothetical protein